MSASQYTSRGGSFASSHDKDLEKGTPGRNSESSDFSTASTQNGNTAPTSQEKTQQPPSEKTAALEWDGPDDVDNPLNWTRKRKIFYTAIPTGIATVCTIASSIYTPGRDGVVQEFGVSAEVAILPFSLYVVGLAFGPILGMRTPITAPCSLYILYADAMQLHQHLRILAEGSCTSLECRYLHSSLLERDSQITLRL